MGRSKCSVGSQNCGLLPTSPSLPSPSSWPSPPSSLSYTGDILSQTFLVALRRQQLHRKWFIAWNPISWQRPGKEQADSRLDLHLPLPLQPHQNSPHPLSFCTDGHNQALCQVVSIVWGSITDFPPSVKRIKDFLNAEELEQFAKDLKVECDKIQTGFQC